MKKGFTLVEMLAVIVILAIISLIIFPEVNKMIKNSKQKSYNTQINSLIDATKKMVSKDSTRLPEMIDGEKRCITLTELKLAGEIDKDVIDDPRNTSHKLTGVIVIEYSREYQQYIYTYNETCPN